MTATVVTGTAGLLLAAGSGSRMGGPKALLPWGSGLLVEHGVRLLAAGGCEPVLVVLGARSDEVRARAALDGVLVVEAADWAQGMGASLRAGLAAVARTDAGAVVVALADQPLVGAGAVVRLRAARAAGAAAAVATYAGRQRNPVLLAREHWAGVAALAVGDVGARPWLRSHPELVVEVACDGTGSPDDLDTPEDLLRMAGTGDRLTR